MRNIVRQLALIAVLAGAAASRTRAQEIASAPDSLFAIPPAHSVGRKSYAIPALEVPFFLAGLSIYDRHAYADVTQDGKKVYSSTWASTWDHLRKQSWVHDQDPFNVNQFEHPYQGATMFSIARSTGNGFWTSLIYSNVGSFMWKMAGETDPPSVDDIITTGQAGSLLGEALYRTASLVLGDRPGDHGQLWRNVLASVVDPPRGINGVVSNDFRTGLQDTLPATSWQLRLGAARDALARDYSVPGTLLQQDATIEYWMSYGLPGRPGYDYNRPLSYFDLQASFLLSASNPVESVMLRGLLIGSKLADHANSRGIWGLYGSYDYISPNLFRVSSTALSLGTTRQDWAGPHVAVQTSILGGAGYGAAGSSVGIPSTPTNEAIRDYHYGVTPQALAALRVIAGNRVMFDFGAREYYITGLGSDDTQGSERIFRGSAGVSLRVIGGHTLGVRFVESTRDAHYGAVPDKRLSEQTVTLSYSFLGANGFSAVKWR